MTDRSDDSPGGIDRLLAIMAKLRNPDGGCPWDLEQSFATIAPYTIEEAYEVADAIQSDDMAALRDELGDLLFQVVFYAQMAREIGAFDFEAVVDGICDKMVRRHPHVFGDAAIRSAEMQTVAWETHKAAERAAELSKRMAQRFAGYCGASELGRANGFSANRTLCLSRHPQHRARREQPGRGGEGAKA